LKLENMTVTSNHIRSRKPWIYYNDMFCDGVYHRAKRGVVFRVDLPNIGIFAKFQRSYHNITKSVMHKEL
jgi:hypothetical protein